MTVPHWQSRPLTEVGQDVRRSAYPDAYAKWEPVATALVAAECAEGAWVKPVDGQVGSGFRTA